MKKSIALLMLLLLPSLCFAAWDKTRPTDSDQLKTSPGVIRDNWQAIETGTDAALLVTNAKVSATAGIVDTKLATIVTPGKVSGAALTLLGSVPAGAGTLPVANTPYGTAANQLVKLDANAKIPALDASLVTGLTATQIPNLDAAKITSGTLPTGRGGTGATGTVNAASGVVVLDASAKLPAVDGSALTAISGNWKAVQSGTVTSGANFTISSLVAGGKYRLFFNVTQNTSVGTPTMRINADAGSNYHWCYYPPGPSYGRSVTEIMMTYTTVGVGIPFWGDIFIQPLNSSNHTALILAQTGEMGSDTFLYTGNLAAQYAGAADVTSVTISTSAGTMTGSWTLYQLA